MVTKNSKPTRKILVKVFEKNGEYEYNTHVLMEVPKGVHIGSMLDKYAKNWYSDPESAEKIDFCGYYLNNGEIFVAVSYVPVTEEDFNVLKKYLQRFIKKMKIKRGKKYLNANGDIVSITSKGAIGNMFHDESGLSYQEDGHYNYDNSNKILNMNQLTHLGARIIQILNRPC